MKQQLGNLERQLVAYAQLRAWTRIRDEDVCRELGLSMPQAQAVLRRLARGGWAARVRPGLFLLPGTLPLGAWSPDETEALTALMEEVGATWQLCGPSAFNRYGFDEQVPNRLTVCNNRQSGVRTIGAVTLQLIKVSDDRLGQTEVQTMASGSQVVYASRVRTLVDAIRDAARFGSLPRAYDWIRKDLAQGKTTAEDLVDVACRAGDKATRRRLGVLLEREGVSSNLLELLERSLPPTTATIPFDSTRPKRGSWSRRWGVIVNDGETNP